MSRKNVKRQQNSETPNTPPPDAFTTRPAPGAVKPFEKGEKDYEPGDPPRKDGFKE